MESHFRAGDGGKVGFPGQAAPTTIHLERSYLTISATDSGTILINEIIQSMFRGGL